MTSQTEQISIIVSQPGFYKKKKTELRVQRNIQTTMHLKILLSKMTTTGKSFCTFMDPPLKITATGKSIFHESEIISDTS